VFAIGIMIGPEPYLYRQHNTLTLGHSHTTFISPDALLIFMATENQGNTRRPNIPVYGNGLVPTYFSGSAVRSDIPYTRTAKVVGALILMLLILFTLWATLRMLFII